MSDPSFGVKPFSISGRMMHQRQRCLGMTDIERQWRAQFLKDQVLSHNEPREVVELYKDTTNFVRRLWRTPMWYLQKGVSSVMGPRIGYFTRHFVGKGTGFIIAAYLIGYYLKYCSNDWTERGKVSWYSGRSRMFPSDPGYPNFVKKQDYEYFDLGFRSSPYAKKIEAPPQTETVPPKVLKDGVEIVCPKI